MEPMGRYWGLLGFKLLPGLERFWTYGVGAIVPQTLHSKPHAKENSKSTRILKASKLFHGLEPKPCPALQILNPQVKENAGAPRPPRRVRVVIA